MLSDRERDTLREIERRLSVEDPNFARYFDTVERRAPGDHHRRAHPGVIAGTATMLAFLLVGPNPLTKTQAAIRTRPPTPRRSSPAPASSRRTQ